MGCINKNMTTTRVPKYEEVRNKKIYELSQIRGNSYNQIARSYDITPQRVGQIVNNYKKKLVNQP
jgi:Mor family transcriptional regulator